MKVDGLSSITNIWMPLQGMWQKDCSNCLRLLRFDFTSRYSTLFAGSPTVPKAIDSDQDDVDDQHFFRRLLAMLKKENFVQSEIENLQMTLHQRSQQLRPGLSDLRHTIALGRPC